MSGREGIPGARSPRHCRRRRWGRGGRPFLRVARDVAAAGVPPETPGQAVLCLVAGLVAVTGTPQRAAERAGPAELMLLTGYFRCWDCERTWTIADGLAENPDGARPQKPSDAGVDGLRRVGCRGGTSGGRPTRRSGDPVPAGRERPARGRRHTLGPYIGVLRFRARFVRGCRRPWRWCPAPVGRPSWPAAGTRAWCACGTWPTAGSSMTRCQDILTAVRSMTTLPLPDGRVLLASGGDSGTIALWNPVTGQPVREPAGDWPGGVTGMCTAVRPRRPHPARHRHPPRRGPDCGTRTPVSPSGASTPMAVRSGRSPPSRSPPTTR